MSLHKFAEQVAANGRGDDSLLVHMTPDEVRNLQRFAEANGTTLTINPETGLPEAGLLSDLFKAVAPIALGAFLGPAGFGLSSAMAGVATGGITALATGSLSRGLMAGLGAYGGAGLGESLMGAGGNALVSGGAPIVEGNIAGAAVPPIEQVNPSNFNLSAADKFSAGAKAVTASPEAFGSFAKQNLGNLAYAASPIMAGMMVPTTTQLPQGESKGMIRQMAFNINPDTGRPDPLYGMREMTPVKASEWGDKTFQGQRDLFYKQNPNPYELGVGSLNQPPRMAGGGIVALAAGGYTPTDKEIFDYFKTPGLTDAQIAADMQKFDVSADRIAQVTGTMDRLPEYNTRFVQAVNTPTTSAEEFMAATKDVGLQNQALENAMDAAGMSQAAQYAATHGLTDTAAPQTDFYNQFGYKTGALPGDQGGLEGYYSNINYSAQGLQSLIDAGKMTGQQAREAALTEMNRIGMSAGDLKAATGKTLAELFPDTKTKIDTKTTGTGTGTTTGTGTDGTGITTVTPQPFTSVIPGGFYGNATNPGDITTNPDGTVTVHPNIPYRPTGGFSGMSEVRNAYTKGGGSLGYTSPVVKTAAEHNALYNRQTGDSLDAYNYLMGRGKNLTQLKTERSSPIMQRYDEAILGRKIGRPVAKTTTTDKKEVVAGDTAVIGGASFDLTDPTQAPPEDNNGPWSWDVVNKKWVQYGKYADGGMTGYAVGGGLSSLGSYSDGGRLLKGPGDGVSDSIPATIGEKQQPARLADGEFVIPARIVSELGNGSTDAGAKKLYAMMDRVQKARGKTTGKNKVAANSRADKYLPA